MITSRSRDPSQVSDAPRVLMLSRRFHPVFGGAAIQAARLSAELADRQCSITIVGARIGALPARETVFGLPVFRTWEVQKGPAALRDLSFALSRSYTFMGPPPSRSFRWGWPSCSGRE